MGVEENAPSSFRLASGRSVTAERRLVMAAACMGRFGSERYRTSTAVGELTSICTAPSNRLTSPVIQSS